MLRSFALVVLVARVAAAGPSKEDVAIAASRTWLAAMHDHDADAMVKTLGFPWLHADCNKQGTSAADDGAARAWFTCEIARWESVFRKPAWTIDGAVKLHVIDVKDLAHRGLGKTEVDRLTALANDDVLVAGSIRVQTSKTSRSTYSFVLAVKYYPTQIDAALPGWVEVAN
jgi:hypothetical protein